MEMKSLHCYFSGTVQGVGFRINAKSIADRSGVKGWVRNLPDGRVELACEGRAGEVDDFLRDLKSSFPRGYISGSNIKEKSSPAGYKSFEIKN